MFPRNVISNLSQRAICSLVMLYPACHREQCVPSQCYILPVPESNMFSRNVISGLSQRAMCSLAMLYPACPREQYVPSQRYIRPVPESNYWANLIHICLIYKYELARILLNTLTGMCADYITLSTKKTG